MAHDPIVVTEPYAAEHTRAALRARRAGGGGPPSEAGRVPPRRQAPERAGHRCSTTSAGATSAATAAASRSARRRRTSTGSPAQGLLLTSCYSEPSCTPSRASLMTGRLPMRHGLLRPPMYGEPGGLAGRGHARRSCSSDAGYVTQAVGKWHMGENAESQPQNVGFDDFYGFLSRVGHVHRVARPVLLPRGRLQRGAHRWVENQPFNKCFVHAHAGRRARERRGGHDPGALACSTTSGPTTRSTSSGAWRRRRTQPWFLYHCTRGAHFDNYPHERFLGVVAGEAPVQGHDHRARRHRRAAGRRARGDRPARGHARLHLVRQRAGDGDVARRRVHAVPLRQGLDVGGRPAGARHRARGPG